MTTTYYYDKNNKCIKKHPGEPRSVSAFERNAANAVRIEVSTMHAYSFTALNFLKNANGNWVGGLMETANGYVRHVLSRKGTLMGITMEPVSDELVRTVIDDEVEDALPEARNAIHWCDPADEKDPDGRYWLNAYAGAGVYRLIVQNGKIVGSIPGGFHGSIRVRCLDESWVRAIKRAVDEKMTGDYQLLKADGSGTYFYLRNAEDAQYLTVKEYDVPDLQHGGLHHNIEVH